MTKQKKCPCCGKMFVCKHSNQRYCKPECTPTGQKAIERQKRKLLPKRTIAEYFRDYRKRLREQNEQSLKVSRPKDNVMLSPRSLQKLHADKFAREVNNILSGKVYIGGVK